MVIENFSLQKLDRQIILKKYECQWRDDHDVHPLIKDVLLNRNVSDLKGIDHTLGKLLHFSSLKGMDEAVHVLVKNLNKKSKVLVIGDYDVDGATASVIAIKGLKILRPDIDIEFLVPNRFEFGYGLTIPLVNEAKKINPNLIITVDNGIVAHEACQLVKSLGIDLLITDHHLSGKTLPYCDAVVNPNQPDDHFLSKNLCGAGVMFYVLLALRSYLRNELSDPVYGKEISGLLDLVALGTVADCVPLDLNNRILVHYGLNLIRQGKCNKGVHALLNYEVKHVYSEDLGFKVAPKLNAAGRMDDMSIGIKCLLAENDYLAQQYASELISFNETRKAVEKTMKNEAINIIESIDIEIGAGSTLALYHPSWHEGVIGLIAARIKEAYQRPTIIFAPSKEGLIKGSARSLPGIHIREVLSKVDEMSPGLIKGYGGHAMAAGLSILESDLNVFRDLYDKVMSSEYSVENYQENWMVDAWIDAYDCHVVLADQIVNLAPYGQGFEVPLFASKMNLVNVKTLSGPHLKLIWDGPEGFIESVWFNASMKDIDFYVKRNYIVVFSFSFNVFR